jgi:hypothetical protein
MSSPPRIQRSYAIAPDAPSKPLKHVQIVDETILPNKQLFKSESSLSISSNQTLEGCWYCWDAMGTGPACLKHQ